MADRRDDLDSWLEGRIEPLPPPPGTFDLIKRRARRRKYRRLAITAGAAAVIVAAVVTVPQVVNLPVLTRATAAGAAHPTAAAAPANPASASASTQTAGATLAPAPVPASFRPTSATFIGTDTGWVIGQAGTPGQCATQYCTSVARTEDAGKTWTGVPAPLAGPPDGATGVSQIRFLTADDGWAFGPELYATDNGGATWAQVATDGLRVTDVETVGNMAFGLFASCTGSGSAFAAQCTSYTLYSSPDSASDWTPVGAATSGLAAGTAGAAASLVLTATRGYLLAPDGMLYAGPVDASAAWQQVKDIPCPTGQPLADGQPTGALLAATDPAGQDLVLACASSQAPGTQQAKTIFTSADGGISWQNAGTAPSLGLATSMAASPDGGYVLATGQGIDVRPAGSSSWQAATLDGPSPQGGFGWVGMTTDTQGIALPANPAAGTVWFSYDGGQSWHPVAVSGS